MQPQQMNQPGFGGEMPGQAMDPMPMQPGMPNQAPGYQPIMPDKNPTNPGVPAQNPDISNPNALPTDPNLAPEKQTPPGAPEVPNNLDAYASANTNTGMDKMPPADGSMNLNAAPSMPNNNEVIDEDETRKGAAEWVNNQDPKTLQITMEEIQKKLGQQPGMETNNQPM